MSEALRSSLVNSCWDEEYAWLCKQRRHYPPNADIWHLRFNWPMEQQRLSQLLLSQEFCFEPLQRIEKADGQVIHLWSARDALVLKRLANILPGTLGLFPRCTHVKNHGGLKATVANVQRHLGHYQHVIRTDIIGYYEHIDQSVLLGQLDKVIKDRFVLNLLGQVVRRTVHYGGCYRDIRKGVSRGCPLSPILGAFYLKSVDEYFSQKDLHYVRYMDDILILTKTRWQLRRAIRTLYELLEPLKLELHPLKTFIGLIKRGFDFLGYRFSHQPLRLAAVTVERFKARYHRLYEQQKTAPDKGTDILRDYVTRWRRWAVAGLDELQTSLYPLCATAKPESS